MILFAGIIATEDDRYDTFELKQPHWSRSYLIWTTDLSGRHDRLGSNAL